MAVDTVSGQVVLSEGEARRLTDEVRNLGNELWLKVLDLYERNAHTALGYGNWKEYWEAEFGGSGTRGEQLLRAGRVARALSEADLPLPANDSTARELVPLLKDPGKLTTVWTAALDASGGRPIGSQVRTLVAPYRRQRTGGWTADGRNIRRLRNEIIKPLQDARGAAGLARAGVEGALKTSPPDTLVRDWISLATEAQRELQTIIEELRNRT